MLIPAADDTTKPPPPPKDPTTVAASTQGKPTVIPTLATLPPTISTISNVPMMQENNIEPSCDSYGVCYDVTLKCTDTKIVVNVQTSRPFHGRIYALGRSETCNLNVRNNQQFTLDISLGGQDCNTQSLVGLITVRRRLTPMRPQGGMYTNTVVLQHHNVVLTKADKVYHVRCTYETTSRNVTFGMMPVRFVALLHSFVSFLLTIKQTNNTEIRTHCKLPRRPKLHCQRL